MRSGEPVPGSQAAADRYRGLVASNRTCPDESEAREAHGILLVGETNHRALQTFYRELARTWCLFRVSLDINKEGNRI